MWWVAIPVILGMFIVIMDTSIVNVALPHMMSAFGVDVEQIQWISTGYMMAIAVMMPTTGFLGDRFGRKRIYVLALFLFTMASVLCGLAWNNESLIVFRVFQGIVGGGIQPVAQAIIFEAFPPEKRGLSMALIGIGAMFAPVIGPTLGGYLVEYLNWRWIFFVNLPFGLFGTFMAFAILRESPRRTVRFDMIGFALMAVFLSTFLLALSQSNEKGWGSNYIVSLLVIAVVSFGLFLIVEFWVREPVIRLSLFRNITYSSGTIASVAMGVGLYGGIFLLPVFLQTLMGYDAIKTGLLMMPQGLAVGIVMPISGIMLNKMDPRIPMATGLGLMGLSLVLQSQMTPLTSLYDIIFWSVLRGIGMAFAFPALSQMALGAFPLKKIGQASGLFNVTRQIGGSFGIAFLATLLTQRTVFHLSSISQQPGPMGYIAEKSTALAQGMMRLGSDPTLAHSQAQAAIGQMAAAQASILAFQEAFLASGIIMFIGMVPVILMKKKPKPAGAPSATMTAE